MTACVGLRFNGDSVPVEYDELVEGGLPVAHGSLPLLRCPLPQTEPEQLADRFVCRKSAFEYLAQTFAFWKSRKTG